LLWIHPTRAGTSPPQETKTMSKETLVEHFAVQEIVVDCFDDYEIRDGLLSCAGYRTHRGENVVVVRIVMPAANLTKVMVNAIAAAKEMPFANLDLMLLKGWSAH
jgi:hypothetical protein